jgi:Polyketide cyclase / dehydrase and lipid transport
MSRFVHSSFDIEIAGRPERVWAVVGDYALDARWRKGIVEMTPDVAGAPKVGTKVHEVLELAGRRYTTDSEVTEVGPMRYRFAGANETGEVRGGRSVRPGSTPGSAHFTYDVEVDVASIPAPVRPVLTWILRRGMRRDLRRLRALVEAG